MRISLDQKIAGYPAIRVRELMRRTAGGPIMFRDVRRILQCSHMAAARVINYLEKDGLIVSVEGSIEPSMKGNALAFATAAPPLRRATASRLLAELIERARDLNADDTWAYRVRRIVVFGSYVRGSERPNDVDIACEMVVRISRAAHADRKAVRLQFCHVGQTTILYAAVGVMHDARLDAPVDQGAVQSSQSQLGAEILSQFPAHNLPRVRVHHNGQIQ